MRRTSFAGVFVAFLFLMVLGMGGSAWAQDGHAIARLRGFEEVPAVSSFAGGRFHADLVGGEIRYELTYFSTQGGVTQAHIHFAQRGVNGGIVAFLCSNLGNGPVGTQACPAAGTQGTPAIITGTIRASDVVGVTAQGIGPGEISELMRAIRAGTAYANVHSTLFPGGELRGQLIFSVDDHGED